MIRLGCVVAGLLLAASIARAEAPVLKPVGDAYQVADSLRGEKKKKKDGYKTAEDVSGVACRPAASGPRLCLIVNDQNSGAQFVTLDQRTITPGPVIDLLGAAPSPATLGSPPPRHDCSAGEGAFSDLDGEGVAYAEPYFYVVGSHGCSRKDNAFNLSAFVLARIRIGATGAATGREPVETTYRLSDALTAADLVAPHFAQDLQTTKRSNGLNIEGVAVLGRRLFVGLRAPSINSVAYIVAIGLDEAFAPGHDRLAIKPAVIPVEIGEGAGIRDLAPLSDDRLLALTGPAQKQDAPYELFAVDAKAGGRAERLGRLATLKGDEKDGKAEAVTLLGPGRILVLFDSLENGGPREYALPPPN